jgi:hypothetical protein
MKKYESHRELKYSELIDEMELILLPFSDSGCSVEVKLVKDYVYHIFMRILNYDSDPLKFDSEKWDDIDRAFDFSKQNGFSINKVYYKVVREDGRIFNKNNRDTSFSYETFKKEHINDKLAYLSFELKQIERKR